MKLEYIRKLAGPSTVSIKSRRTDEPREDLIRRETEQHPYEGERARACTQPPPQVRQHRHSGTF